MAPSTLFKHKAKTVHSPAGRRVLVIRASVRHTAGTALTSWPPPCSQDGQNGGPSQGIDRLPGAADLASWATPTTRDYKDGEFCPNVPINALLGREAWLARTPVVNDGTGSKYAYSQGDHDKVVLKLPGAADLASWPTPQTQDSSGGGQAKRAMAEARHGSNLNDFAMLAQLVGPARLTASGQILTGFFVETTNGGQLNPSMSRFLMGFPKTWDQCAPLMRKPRKKVS